MGGLLLGHRFLAFRIQSRHSCCNVCGALGLMGASTCGPFVQCVPTKCHSFKWAPHLEGVTRMASAVEARPAHGSPSGCSTEYCATLWQGGGSIHCAGRLRSNVGGCCAVVFSCGQSARGCGFLDVIYVHYWYCELSLGLCYVRYLVVECVNAPYV